MSQIKRYKNSITFILLIVLSVLVICNLIGIQEDFIKQEVNLTNFITFIIFNFAIIQYIHKIIGRLRINRKKLFKLQLYIKENIVILLKRHYRNGNYK